MNLSQHEVAHLSDDDIKRAAVMLAEIGEILGGPLQAQMRATAYELVRARRERCSSLLLLEAEAMNDDGPGALVDEGKP